MKTANTQTGYQLTRPIGNQTHCQDGLLWTRQLKVPTHSEVGCSGDGETKISAHFPGTNEKSRRQPDKKTKDTEMKSVNEQRGRLPPVIFRESIIPQGKHKSTYDLRVRIKHGWILILVTSWVKPQEMRSFHDFFFQLSQMFEPLMETALRI